MKKYNTQTLLVMVALCLVAVSLMAQSDKPNVVVIFADDLGYGDTGVYGATKVRTPNIDKLASEGRRFTDAHAASAVCTPSRYCLLTGEYAFRIDNWGPVFLKVGLIVDPDQTTVADIMKNAGYATACIGKWHLGFGEETPNWNGDLKPGPLELGFDYYFGMPVVNSHPPFVYVENHRVVGLAADDPFVYDQVAETRVHEEKMGINQIGGAKAAHALYDDTYVGTTLAGKAVSWIKEHKDEPFFLYFPTTNIHHPFTPHPRFQGTSDCGRYGDFIHELDWIVGEVTRTLEEEGLADNTLLIFTSDNGGMINLGGQNSWNLGHKQNGDLLGFKFDAWEGGHRVPFIARWPGKIPAGTVSNQLVSNVDLLASLAALTGYELKDGEGPDSFNILPALIGEAQRPIRDHLVLAAFRKTHLSLRAGDWMYIGAQSGGGFSSPDVGTHGFGGFPALHFAGEVNSDMENGKLKPNAPKEQLYNLRTDPYQTQNVIRENPVIAQTMREHLAYIRSSKGTR
ncbi:MAG: arylsulfatase [Verrucomicrobia bacterium]|nr:arylsulfatase [Verrucomicrobiota bacterium]